MSMLRSIREKKGLTLGQLAARASISARTLTEYEEGRQPIPLSHAKLLAKALWVQIEDLMPPAGAAAAAVAARPAPAPVASPPAAAPQQTAAAPVAPAPQYAPRPAAPAPAVQQPVNGSQAAGQYASRPQEQQFPPRPPRDAQQGFGQRPAGPPTGGRKGPDSRGPRPARPPAPPPKPITEGQTEELLRLGSRLGMEQEQLEEQLGKQVANLTRGDAKDWIKKLREQAAESSPGGKVHYGHWPGSREDEEATYLSNQREAGKILRFKLFNGEEVTGTVTEFTPYTITVQNQPGGEETVLRKLAIVYYRQTSEVAAQMGTQPQSQEVQQPEPAPVAEPAAGGQSAVPHSHPTEETGIDSDRVDEPTAPESDNMDEDRGV